MSHVGNRATRLTFVMHQGKKEIAAVYIEDTNETVVPSHHYPLPL